MVRAVHSFCRGLFVVCEEAGVDGYPSEPKREELSRSDWDLKELMDRLGGDQEFLQELLVIFLQDARMNLEKSRTALERNDLTGLSRTAHTLKGMLRNLAMGSVAEIAAVLEKAAGAGLRKESEALLMQLTNELGEILPEVEAHLAGVKS